MIYTCLPTLSRLFHRHRAAAGPTPPSDANTAAGPPAPKTYTYATRATLALQVDVHLPARHPGWPSPSVIFFHGGGLLYGDRRFILQGLCDDCLARGWTFLSFDYRKLLPCSGHDVLADLHAAFTYYHTVLVARHDLSATNVFVAGYSAGAYLAQLAAAHWEPKPLGVFLVAAQGGRLLAPHYFARKDADADAESDSDATAPYLARRTATVGALPQSDPATAAEFWARARVAHELWRRGLFLDALTGDDGLGARLARATADFRERCVAESARALFPELLVDESHPPAFVVHAENDATVLRAEADALVASLRAKCVPAALVVVPGAAHTALIHDVVYANYMAAGIAFLERRLVADEGEEDPEPDEDDT